MQSPLKLVIILFLFTSILTATIVPGVLPGGSSSIWMPNVWKHNLANILVIKGFLDESAPITQRQGSLQQAIPLLSDGPVEQMDVTKMARLGQVYLQLGKFSEAEMWLARAIQQGTTDIRVTHWRIDAQLGGGKTMDAVHTLVDLLRFAPQDTFAENTLNDLYAATAFPGERFSSPGDEGNLTILPGEQYSVTLSLAPTLPRWLKLSYQGDRDSRMEIFMAEEHLASLEGNSRYPRQVSLLNNDVDPVLVRIENRGDSPIELASLWLEYMTNVEIFDDVVEANWTTIPYKVIPAGRSYETYLRLPATTARTLVVSMFVFPDRYLDVSVDGVLLGRIDGGKAGTPGGPTPFAFPVPAEAADVIKVTLHCPPISPPGGVALRYIYLQADEQLPDNLYMPLYAGE